MPPGSMTPSSACPPPGPTPRRRVWETWPTGCGWWTPRAARCRWPVRGWGRRGRAPAGGRAAGHAVDRRAPPPGRARRRRRAGRGLGLPRRRLHRCRGGPPARRRLDERGDPGGGPAPGARAADADQRTRAGPLQAPGALRRPRGRRGPGRAAGDGPGQRLRRLDGELRPDAHRAGRLATAGGGGARVQGGAHRPDRPRPAHARRHDLRHRRAARAHRGLPPPPAVGCR